MFSHNFGRKSAFSRRHFASFLPFECCHLLGIDIQGFDYNYTKKITFFNRPQMLPKLHSRGNFSLRTRWWHLFRPPKSSSRSNRMVLMEVQAKSGLEFSQIPKFRKSSSKLSENVCPLSVVVKGVGNSFLNNFLPTFDIIQFFCSDCSQSRDKKPFLPIK